LRRVKPKADLPQHSHSQAAPQGYTGQIELSGKK